MMFLTGKDSTNSDEDLLDAFQKTKDASILGSLFSRYSVMVYGVCLKYLKDRDEAKDATMQLFEKLQDSLQNHKIDYFKSWLYATSKNHCLMKLRAQKGRFKEEIKDEYMETDPVLHLDNDDTWDNQLEKLERCIEQLKDEQKVCVELFYLKEKCYKDIASNLKIELQKVKSHIQNGKRNLKICMEQN